MTPDPHFLRRRARGAIVAGLGAGVLVWIVGVSVAQSAFIGLLAAAAVPLLLVPPDAPMALPRLPTILHHGSRSDVSRLGWAMTGRKGHVDQSLIRRLRAVATSRLKDLHIDIEDPAHAGAAQSALGVWAYSVVAADQSVRLRRAEVVRLVDAVERLGELRAAGGSGALHASPGGGTVGRKRS